MIGAQQDFSYMDDRALQTALQFAQRSNNTPTFLALMAEANKRKQMRQEAQGLQAGAQAAKRPGTVADQVMQGIANLDSGDHEYAAGGIVSFDDGGPVMYDAKGDPYEHLWHAAGSSDKNTPYWDSLKEAFGFPIETLKRVIGAPNQRQYRTGEPQPAQKSVPLPPTGAGGGRGNINPATVTPQDTPTAAPRPAPGGIATLATSSKAKVPAPAAAETPLEKTLTPEEYKARAEAMAKGDNEKLDAIYAKAAARADKRQAALDAETADSEGILGLKFGADKREALRNFGLALMAGKDPNALVNVGNAGIKAGEAYTAAKKERANRADALAEYSTKMELAQYEARRGNTEAANKYVKQAEDAKQQAFGNKLERDKFGEQKRHNSATEALQQQQIRTAAAAANRTPAEIQLVERMQHDPKFAEAYRTYLGDKAGPGTEKAVALQMLKGDPMLQQNNPELYQKLVALAYGSAPPAVSAPVGGVRQ